MTDDAFKLGDMVRRSAKPLLVFGKPTKPNAHERECVGAVADVVPGTNAPYGVSWSCRPPVDPMYYKAESLEPALSPRKTKKK